MKTGLSLGTLVLTAVFQVVLPGCKTPPACEPLTSCGGDVLAGATDIWKADGVVDKEWIVTGPTSCMDQLQTPPVTVSLVRQPPHLANERPTDRATSDWCSNITFKQDGTISQFLAWYPPIPVRDGTLIFSADGRYSMQFNYFARRRLEFPATCLQSQGLNQRCATVGRHLKSFVAAEANIFNPICVDDPDHLNGCVCEFDLLMIGGPNGPFVINGNTITFFDDLFGPPAFADYCTYESTDSNGNPVALLDLTGQGGTRLLNQPALRTLQFNRPTCSDGVQSKTLKEEGIDCGGDCPNKVCPKCDDMMQNGNEKGIDCGGSCPELCDCRDGQKNDWEEGVDCGGPCLKTCI